MSTHQLVPGARAVKTPLTDSPGRSGLLQRTCACGGTTGLNGECEKCRDRRLSLQRKTQKLEPETNLPYQQSSTKRCALQANPLIPPHAPLSRRVLDAISAGSGCIPTREQLSRRTPSMHWPTR
jgi:hypothetical protein